ncbi:uncharacterized protein LOC108710653 isoform X2 [Xenopus laevis]|uniref:Uncharacterized protein LOC108710653 isoform X2 n=1 Tax=Xenopus laevis TaxID=8355 RepID=A0A8J1MND6_XENLA|nr:uncharacterized protein LOC108710653 isoform X2 [Xenopus laevis]
MKNMISSLLLLLFFQGIGRTSSDHFCAHQIRTIRVTEGQSITIPCTFTYNRNIYDKGIRIDWGVSTGRGCWESDTSYDILSISKYSGRIFRLDPPYGNNSASITIHRLRPTDGPVICCRVEASGGSVPPYTWNNRYGTLLIFSEPAQISVEQLDVIPALPGETITIPCYVHYPPGTRETLQTVTWRKGPRPVCISESHPLDTQDKTGRYSVVDFPTDVSLQINRVQREDSGYYCCIVRTSKGENNIRSGTELVIEEQSTQQELDIRQSHNTTVSEGDSVTLNCSFHSTQTPLWAWIYWRVGSPTGDYVYHPNKQMVHSSFKGRTELRGQADLHIEGVQRNDSDTYYCIVIFQYCAANSLHKSFFNYGQGTRLDVIEAEFPLIIILSVVLILIVLSGILIFLLYKGFICKKESPLIHIQENKPEDKGHSRGCLCPTQHETNGTSKVT